VPLDMRYCADLLRPSRGELALRLFDRMLTSKWLEVAQGAQGGVPDGSRRPGPTSLDATPQGIDEFSRLGIDLTAQKSTAQAVRPAHHRLERAPAASGRRAGRGVSRYVHGNTAGSRRLPSGGSCESRPPASGISPPFLRRLAAWNGIAPLKPTKYDTYQIGSHVKFLARFRIQAQLNPLSNRNGILQIIIIRNTKLLISMF